MKKREGLDYSKRKEVGIEGEKKTNRKEMGIE